MIHIGHGDMMNGEYSMKVNADNSCCSEPVLSFLGIGAQKCGTSWLYKNLSRHPEISFPGGKEVHFWDAARSMGVNHYKSWLDVGDGKFHGDITPAYGILEPAVIAECQAAFPKLKLLYLIRNPIERAWSAACMGLARAEMNLEEASDAWFIDHFRSSGSLRRGDYERCLRNWHNAYGEQAILVLRFEDLLKRPSWLLNQCCLHIGVHPLYTRQDPDLSRIVNRSKAGSIRPSLLPILTSLYGERIRSLECYLDEDFSSWLSPSLRCQ